MSESYLNQILELQAEFKKLNRRVWFSVSPAAWIYMKLNFPKSAMSYANDKVRLYGVKIEVRPDQVEPIVEHEEET